MLFVTSVFKFFVSVFFDIYFYLFGKPKIDKALQKTINLYSNSGFLKNFSLIRIWDAPFPEINKLVPSKGLIVDLGSGDGILTNYLATASKNRKIIGIEIDNDRFKKADKGLKNAIFIKGSIVTKQFPKADAFILSHVLHHLPGYKSQEIVIKKCLKNLNKNGKLIIIEIAEKPYLKYLFTWITDAIIVPILFEKRLFNFKFYYRKTSDWIKLLTEMKFKVKHKFLSKDKPFSHLLIISTK